MKKIYIILLYLLLFGSCSNDEPYIIIDPDEISYGFFSGGEAANTQPGWSTNDAIGISVYISGSNTIYSGYKNKQYQVNGDGFFIPATDNDKIFRSLSGAILDFVAYCPYKANTSDGYIIDLSDQSSQKSIDVLYSNNAKNQTNTSGNTELVFNHALSKIIVYAKPGVDITTEELLGISITIDNVYDNAILSMENGSIKTSNTETSSILMRTKTDETVCEAIILPGTSSGVGLTVRLGNNNEYKADLPENQEFKSGKIYLYNLIINRTNIIFTPSEIIDWNGIEDIPDAESATEIAYNAGDFYPNPTDAKTAIGVVYWTRPGSNGKEGKMVSLDSDIQKWSENGSAALNNSITNGLINIADVQLLDPSLQQFPAFLWCNSKGSGWYLPSRYELHILQELWIINREIIDQNILLAGGEIFTETDVYLSSSESRSYPATMVETYDFSDKGWPSISKTEQYRIRAIKLF